MCIRDRDAGHGVLPPERINPQPFVVDIDLELDLSWAGASDDLSDTISYADLADRAAAVIQGPSAVSYTHLDVYKRQRTRVIGIVNVTPDSFSDGGRYLAADAAVAHGRTLLAQGADLLDIGGESTRPGAQRPDEAEELRRVIPVIRALAQAGAVVSVDTMRAQVAAEALAAGARIVNDVSGGLADPEILQVAAGRPDTTYVVMHWLSLIHI